MLKLCAESLDIEELMVSHILHCVADHSLACYKAHDPALGICFALIGHIAKGALAYMTMCLPSTAPYNLI
jgi:hypothetical protein